MKHPRNVDDVEEIRRFGRWVYEADIRDPRLSVSEIAARDDRPEWYVAAALEEARRLLSIELPGDRLGGRPF